MPDPVTVLLGGLVLLVALGLVSFSRFHRLRTHIDDSAAAVAAERERRDRLMERAVEGHLEDQVVEQVAEAEDRLEAVNRLHTAQVRAWNRLGRGPYWRLLRGVTGWQPLPEHPAVSTDSDAAPGAEQPGSGSTAATGPDATAQAPSADQRPAKEAPRQSSRNGGPAQPRNGAPAQPRNGGPAQPRNGAPAQPRNGATQPESGASTQPRNGAKARPRDVPSPGGER